MLNHALAEHRAHPMLLATIGHELARRAGFTSLVAHTAGHYWTVLTGIDCDLPIGYDATPDALNVSQLRACCAHEISHRALVAIAAGAPCDRARRAGHLCTALIFACRAATSTCTTDHSIST